MSAGCWFSWRACCPRNDVPPVDKDRCRDHLVRLRPLLRKLMMLGVWLLCVMAWWQKFFFYFAKKLVDVVGHVGLGPRFYASTPVETGGAAPSAYVTA